MNRFEQLDSVLTEIITRWGIPGLGVGMVEDGEIVYSRGFGVQSLETGVPVADGSVFCVASVSKCFVASAVLQLVERGRLELDAPLIRYLPDFRLDDARFPQITLRQMLSHTSGMPDMDEADYDEMVSHPEFDEGAPERYLRSLAAYKMTAGPGERFAYSNIAYNVLGCLIARVSGLTFEDYMKEHILRPAGMDESTFMPSEIPPGRLAVPHLRAPGMMVNPVYPYHRADAPASFLHATVGDMCRWAAACMDGGLHRGRRFLSPASFELMWSPAARWGFPPLYEDTGLGWTLGHYEGVKTVSHGGMGFGWTDFLTLLPEKRRAGVILCNEESSARSRTVRAVLNTLLEREPVVNTVSWMVPAARAMQTGGEQAVRACYFEIKDNPDYFFDPDELHNLAYQLCSARKPDLAAETLELNLSVFPDHLDSRLFLARLYLQSGEKARAAAALRQALELDPANPAALLMVEKMQWSS